VKPYSNLGTENEQTSLIAVDKMKMDNERSQMIIEDFLQQLANLKSKNEYLIEKVNSLEVSK